MRTANHSVVPRLVAVVAQVTFLIAILASDAQAAGFGHPAVRAVTVQSQTFKRFGCTLAVAEPQVIPLGIISRVMFKCNKKGSHSLVLGSERFNPPGTWPPEAPRTLLPGAVFIKSLPVARKSAVHAEDRPFSCSPGIYDTFVEFGQKRKGQGATAVFRTSAVQVTC